MKRRILHTNSLVLIVSALLLCGCWGIIEVATLTPSPTATMIETDTPIETDTVAPVDTLTSTDAHTPTQAPSDTPSPTATMTETQTATHTPTVTPSASFASPVSTTLVDDPTPTREVLQTAPALIKHTLAEATYFYACADAVCTRYLFPKGTVYEIWDTGTNAGWVGVAVVVTDYMYATFWMRVIISPQ